MKYKNSIVMQCKLDYKCVRDVIASKVQIFVSYVLRVRQLFALVFQENNYHILKKKRKIYLRQHHQHIDLKLKMCLNYNKEPFGVGVRFFSG